MGFTTGLLHDLGRIAMAETAPERYAHVVRAVRTGADPRPAEREVFGDDHQQWGMRMASSSNLPSVVSDAIGHHHGSQQSLVPDAVDAGRRVALAVGSAMA